MYVIQLTGPCDDIVLIREVLKVIYMSSPCSLDVTGAMLTLSSYVVPFSGQYRQKSQRSMWHGHDQLQLGQIYTFASMSTERMQLETSTAFGRRGAQCGLRTPKFWLVVSLCIHPILPCTQDDVHVDKLGILLSSPKFLFNYTGYRSQKCHRMST